MATLVLSPRNSIAQLVSLHSILNNPLANTLLKIPGSDHVILISWLQSSLSTTDVCGSSS